MHKTHQVSRAGCDDREEAGFILMSSDSIGEKWHHSTIRKSHLSEFDLSSNAFVCFMNSYLLIVFSFLEYNSQN